MHVHFVCSSKTYVYIHIEISKPPAHAADPIEELLDCSCLLGSEYNTHGMCAWFWCLPWIVVVAMTCTQADPVHSQFYWCCCIGGAVFWTIHSCHVGGLDDEIDCQAQVAVLTNVWVSMLVDRASRCRFVIVVSRGLAKLCWRLCVCLLRKGAWFFCKDWSLSLVTIWF